MEEDMIKSHFEQIIMISQKQHYRRTQVHFLFNSCTNVYVGLCVFHCVKIDDVFLFQL